MRPSKPSTPSPTGAPPGGRRPRRRGRRPPRPHRGLLGKLVMDKTVAREGGRSRPGRPRTRPGGAPRRSPLRGSAVRRLAATKRRFPRIRSADVLAGIKAANARILIRARRRLAGRGRPRGVSHPPSAGLGRAPQRDRRRPGAGRTGAARPRDTAEAGRPVFGPPLRHAARRPRALTWYSVFRGAGKVVAAALTRLEVEGAEHVPAAGPFFLIANHGSALDPVLVQSSCPRSVHSLAKSTQFSSPLSAWALPRANAVPARRHRVDPQVVRTVLRLLADGKGVCIYPEGERSWDGTLQPLRRGTVRLILKVGVPVVPCGVAGSFDAWPRWSAAPSRIPVTVRFGPPMRFGVHHGRDERERALDETSRRLAQALRRLSRGAGAQPKRVQP